MLKTGLPAGFIVDLRTRKLSAFQTTSPISTVGFCRRQAHAVYGRVLQAHEQLRTKVLQSFTPPPPASRRRGDSRAFFGMVSFPAFLVANRPPIRQNRPHISKTPGGEQMAQANEQPRFDRIIDRRSTESIKWNRFDEDVLPMWVADMDFLCADPVVDALRDRVEHGIYGYPSEPSELRGILVDRLERRFGWSIEPEWIVFIPVSYTHLTLPTN